MMDGDQPFWMIPENPAKEMRNAPIKFYSKENRPSAPLNVNRQPTDKNSLPPLLTKLSNAYSCNSCKIAPRLPNVCCCLVSHFELPMATQAWITVDGLGCGALPHAVGVHLSIWLLSPTMGLAMLHGPGTVSWSICFKKASVFASISSILPCGSRDCMSRVHDENRMTGHWKNPRHSMYGVFTYIWSIYVNPYGKCT